MRRGLTCRWLKYLSTVLLALVSITVSGHLQGADRTALREANNKSLGSILNNDINNILGVLSGAKTTPAEYKKAVLHLLDAKPGVLAQNVGMPDPVIYRSQVA